MAELLEGTSAYEISSSGMVAALSPEMGGRLLRLRTRQGTEVVVPAPPHSFETTAWPRAGAYPLIPYHNRISDAAISVEGRAVSLVSHPAADPHTLHGPSHTHPWTLTAHESSKLTMMLDYPADDHWPWNFRALQTFELMGTQLKLVISLKNTGQTPMPAGLGWHPYFMSAEHVHTDASKVWPHEADYLPTGERLPVMNEDRESTAPTRYLEGWTEARVRLAGGGVALLSASQEFGFLVVHRGDRAHICVEPVTHVANAWNLKADHTSTGARILMQGEVLAGSISVRVAS